MSDKDLHRISAALEGVDPDLIALIEQYGSSAIDWGYESGRGVTNQYMTDPYANIRRAEETYHASRLAMLEKIKEALG